MVTGRMSTIRSDSATASISGWPCASMNPGMTQPSPISMVWVPAPMSPADVGPVAHGDDPAVGDRERLGGGPLLVDGQHGSGDDEICVGHVQQS